MRTSQVDPARPFERRKRVVSAVLMTVAAASLVLALSPAQSQPAAQTTPRQQAKILREVNDFLTEDLLGEAGRGREVSMREVLDRASSKLDEACRAGGRFWPVQRHGAASSWGSHRRGSVWWPR